MNPSFEVFNQILQGEHMAIQTYQAYIDSLPNSPLRNHLVAILTDHKAHASRLAYYIQTNGGKVKEGVGLAGLASKWSAKMQNWGENESLNMIEKLYSGEDRGLARAVQLSENKLSDAEREVLEPIFSDEHDHLKRLLHLKEDLVQ
jgi:rubrerythrin